MDTTNDQKKIASELQNMAALVTVEAIARRS